MAGMRGRELVHLACSGRDRTVSTTIGNSTEVHRAAGLDIAWTREGLRVVGPGTDPRTLSIYGMGAQPLLIARRSPAYSLLAYDEQRHIFHLVFCGWSEDSSMYDVVYYMRSADAGRTWTRADGSPFILPFEYRWRGPEPDVLSRRQQNAGGEADTLAQSLVLDAEGYPHVIYSFCMPYAIGVGPAEPPNRQPLVRTKHVRWTGSEWKASEEFAGAGMEIAGGSLVMTGKTSVAVVSYRSFGQRWLDLGYAQIVNDGSTSIQRLSEAGTSHRGNLFAPVATATGAHIHYVCAVAGRDVQAPLEAGQFIAPESGS